MKKKIISALLTLMVMVSIIPKREAHADMLTVTQLAAVAYAYAAQAGMSFSTIGSAGTIQNYMENRVNGWLGSDTIVEKFGSAVIKSVAGRLVVPAVIINWIKNRINDVAEQELILKGERQARVGYNITNGYFINGVPGGNFSGAWIKTEDWGLNTSRKFVAARLLNVPNPTGISVVDDGSYVRVYNGQTQMCYLSYNNNYLNFWYLGLDSDLNAGLYKITGQPGNHNFGNGNEAGYQLSRSHANFSMAVAYNVTADISNGYNDLYPEGLSDLQSWEGNIGAAADTNLEQLLSDIFESVEAGSLEVQGEVVNDTVQPSPEPTAIPTRPPVDDTVDGLNDLIEGQDVISGQLEGIGTGVGTISETIDQALDIPSAEEIAENDGAAFKFDLRTLFPFCIPFDIYRLVSIFDVEPVTPHFALPFDIPAIGLEYSFDIDFSEFDGLAAILRNVELVAFCVGLAFATRKVIRW